MKTLTLWTIILILFTSCSTDSETSISNDNQSNLTATSLHRNAGIYPENSNNTYDAAGQLYYAISDSYLTEGNISVTTSATILQVETIANLNVDFQELRPAVYNSPAASRIDYIMSNQAAALSIIANSSMSARAKSSLTGFITSVMSYHDQQKEYDVIYKYIIDYESIIIADNLLTANDKKIMLTTSSITRYGFYFASKHRRKPRDRDWEISWGHIVAGTDGSEHSTAEAIVISTVCGIISNN